MKKVVFVETSKEGPRIIAFGYEKEDGFYLRWISPFGEELCLFCGDELDMHTNLCQEAKRRIEVEGKDFYKVYSARSWLKDCFLEVTDGVYVIGELSISDIDKAIKIAQEKMAEF